MFWIIVFVLVLYAAGYLLWYWNRRSTYVRRKEEGEPKCPNVLFDDAAGREESKRDLQQLVRFLVSSERYRAMVCEFGMSGLGPVKIEESQAAYPSGQQDVAIKEINEEADTKATAILTRRRAPLDLVAKALLEKETIEREEFETIVARYKPDKLI